MPSFDVVSEVDKVALTHAVDNTKRELSTRFDFRGAVAEIELDEFTVKMTSESDFQVRQIQEIFRNQCAKRDVSTLGVTAESKPVQSGKTYSLSMIFKQGIEQDDAKKLVKLLKDAKLKVQASIQGDKLRISGKKRDDLQEAIAFLKKAEFPLPMQFNNFRD